MTQRRTTQRLPRHDSGASPRRLVFFCSGGGIATSDNAVTARTCTSAGKSVQVPWMNLLNLCTSVQRLGFSVSSRTHAGASVPSARLSFTSSTACGKRVMSVRASSSSGSRNLHAPCTD